MRWAGKCKEYQKMQKIPKSPKKLNNAEHNPKFFKEYQKILNTTIVKERKEYEKNRKHRDYKIMQSKNFGNTKISKRWKGQTIAVALKL